MARCQTASTPGELLPTRTLSGEYNSIVSSLFCRSIRFVKLAELVATRARMHLSKMHTDRCSGRHYFKEKSHTKLSNFVLSVEVVHLDRPKFKLNSLSFIVLLRFLPQVCSDACALDA